MFSPFEKMCQTRGWIISWTVHIPGSFNRRGPCASDLAVQSSPAEPARVFLEYIQRLLNLIKPR